MSAPITFVLNSGCLPCQEELHGIQFLETPRLAEFACQFIPGQLNPPAIMYGRVLIVEMCSPRSPRRLASDVGGL